MIFVVPHGAPEGYEWLVALVTLVCLYFAVRNFMRARRWSRARCDGKQHLVRVRALGFDRGHTRIELSVVCFTVSARMNASMTIWAKSDHMCGMIRTAIA